MCLILFRYKDHPKYPLILAANRDEFYNRPTQEADFWTDHPDIIGGRDLSEGGTWMGITTKGKFGMLTNYRDIPGIIENAPSRGHLVSDFLKGDAQPEEYISEIQNRNLSYNGYNLIVGHLDQWYYLSNYGENYQKVEPGIHGLSNALLNSNWHKVVKGKELLSTCTSSDEIDIEDLFSLLRDESKAKPDMLPETGLSREKETALSSMFINTEGYGSRCSTAILMDNKGEITFVERTYLLPGNGYSEKKFKINV